MRQNPTKNSLRTTGLKKKPLTDLRVENFFMKGRVVWVIMVVCLVLLGLASFAVSHPRREWSNLFFFFFPFWKVLFFNMRYFLSAGQRIALLTIQKNYHTFFVGLAIHFFVNSTCLRFMCECQWHRSGHAAMIMMTKHKRRCHEWRVSNKETSVSLTAVNGSSVTLPWDWAIAGQPLCFVEEFFYNDVRWDSDDSFIVASGLVFVWTAALIHSLCRGWDSNSYNASYTREDTGKIS